MKSKKDGSLNIKLLILLPIILIIAFTIYSNITSKNFEEYSKYENDETKLASNYRGTVVTSRADIDRTEVTETETADLSDVDLLQEYID